MSGSYGTFSTKQEEKRKRTVPDRVLIKRVYEYAKAYRRSLSIGIAATVISAFTSLAAPYMHAIAIDKIITPSVGNAKNLTGFFWWIPLFVTIILGN